MTEEQIKSKAKEQCPNDEFAQQIIIDAINWATKKLEKENADLEEKLANADYQLEGRDNEIAELKKDKQNLRADLRTARNNLRAKDTAYQLAMEELNYAKTHCLFHSDCPTQKENAELKEKYDTCLRENTGLKIHSAYVEKKFTKAKEIIKKLLDAYEYVIRYEEYADREILKQAEQFINSEEEK